MTREKRARSVVLEDVGHVYFGICRGEDVWGNWHEDDWFCTIETKDGRTIDVTQLIEEVFDVGYTYCAISNRGSECEEERKNGDECPYKDGKGLCNPPLFKFKISIEAEPF